MKYKVIAEFLCSNNYEDISKEGMVSVTEKEFNSKRKAKKFFEKILYEDTKDNVATYILFDEIQGDIICEVGIPVSCFTNH